MSTTAHEQAIADKSKMISIPLSSFGRIVMHAPYMSAPDENGTVWFMNRTTRYDYKGNLISDKTTKGIGISCGEPEPTTFTGWLKGLLSWT